MREKKADLVTQHFIVIDNPARLRRANVNSTTSKAEIAEAETKAEQRKLATNAWHLARYLIEHDHEIQLPKRFNPGQFLNWAEHYPELTREEKIEFVNQYAKLEKVAVNVTARTLVATRIHGEGFFHAAFATSVGQYLLFLALVTFGFVALLIQNIFDGKADDNFAIAFYAAGMGTCVYLLRVTQQKLRSREFDPANIPSQLIRLGLGVLAGGSIVLFPGLLTSQDGKLPTGLDVGQGALAFVLGYAVNIFYAVLDNIGGKIKKI